MAGRPVTLAALLLVCTSCDDGPRTSPDADLDQDADGDAADADRDHEDAGSDGGDTDSESADSDSDETDGDAETDGDGTWSVWTQREGWRFRGQIWEGGFSVASDPSVVRDGDTLRMVYTCATTPTTPGLCEVASADGFDWTPVTPSVVPGVDGAVLAGRPGEWDENLETCAALHEEDGIRLFVSGYRTPGPGDDRPAAAIEEAFSEDGVAFERRSDEPVLEPTPRGLDSDDMFSPAVLVVDRLLHMVYVGYCVPGWHDRDDCDATPAIQIVGATRSAEGVWSKLEDPVLAPREDLWFMRYGVAEPDLVDGGDGSYYLFFTGGLGDDEPRVTGLARGPAAFGPWDVAPEPVVAPAPGAGYEACGTFAPSVLVEADRGRMWYLALDDCGGDCPSCLFDECGCFPTFSIAYAEGEWPPFSP